MASNYPTSLDNFTNPTSNDSLNSPSHSLQHANINDAVEAIEAKLGIGASPAGSATSGYVLTAGTGGTTTWSEPSIAGLTLVKTQTIGTAVSSVEVTGAFNSTYDNYRIVISKVDSSVAADLKIQFGSTTNEHYFSGYYDFYGSGTTGTTRGANVGSIYLATTGTNDDTNTSFDVYSPNLAVRTALSGTYDGFAYAGWFGGAVNTTIQYTSFSILVSSGTMTGGTIRVYGYRNS